MDDPDLKDLKRAREMVDAAGVFVGLMGGSMKEKIARLVARALAEGRKEAGKDA